MNRAYHTSCNVLTPSREPPVIAPVPVITPSGRVATGRARPKGWILLLQRTAIAGGALVILASAAFWAMRLGLTYPCPFKFLSGLPCPTCGTTRSLAALTSLDLVASLKFNPLVILGAVGIVFGASLRDLWPGLRKKGIPIFLTALLLNWVYLLITLR